MSSVGAGAGVVLLGDEHGPLTLQAEHGMRTRACQVPDVVVVGRRTARSALRPGVCPVRRSRQHRTLSPGDGEPSEREVLAVPLRRGRMSTGCSRCSSHGSARASTRTDEDALRALAGQAAIAVENVLLHAEARRASTIDPLTGLWNFRYLMMSLNQEIERRPPVRPPAGSPHARPRPLQAGQRHVRARARRRGAARVRQRVRAQIREVDTLARYGGEEFVLVLPETTARRCAEPGRAHRTARPCATLRR